MLVYHINHAGTPMQRAPNCSGCPWLRKSRVSSTAIMLARLVCHVDHARNQTPMYSAIQGVGSTGLCIRWYSAAPCMLAFLPTNVLRSWGLVYAAEQALGLPGACKGGQPRAPIMNATWILHVQHLGAPAFLAEYCARLSGVCVARPVKPTVLAHFADDIHHIGILVLPASHWYAAFPVYPSVAIVCIFGMLTVTALWVLTSHVGSCRVLHLIVI